MAQVGVRELKARASEIIRAVRERRARYVITYRGRPVGVLLPLDEASRGEVVDGTVQTVNPAILWDHEPIGGRRRPRESRISCASGT